MGFTDRFAAGLVQVAIHGGKVQDVLRGILGTLASEALRGLLRSLIGALFTSGGISGGGGILSLFGGSFAEGGDLPAGRFGIAGERGPELIQGPAAITPFRQVNAALNSGGGGRGGGRVNMTIDVRGARGNAEIHEMIASGVRAGMTSVHDKIARDIGPLSVKWDRRYG